ncbi:MAG: hypothetical protein CME60_05380 [Halobacteriovoraceae bacterium]|nr:hypothetical protein [Halobacteriovoraceae bacterium]
MFKFYTVGVDINIFSELKFTLKYILIIGGVLSISSCGIKGPNTKSTPIESFSALELQCSQGAKLIEMPSYKKTIQKIEEIDSFLALYNGLSNRESKRIFRPFVGLKKQSTSPQDPLILGEEENLAELEAIEDSWIEAIGEENWYSFLAAKQTQEGRDQFHLKVAVDTDEMETVLKSLNRQLDKVERWNYLQCNLKELKERKKKDIRPYLHYLEERQKFCSEEHCSENELVENKLELLKICENYQNPTTCEIEFLHHKRKKSLHQFESHYIEKSKEAYNKFFKIDVLNKWNCHKEEEITYIEVPYYIDEKFKLKIDQNIEYFESFVEKRWGQGPIQIKLKQVHKETEKAVRVQWNQSSVSFVEYAHPLIIHMSEGLSYKRLMLIYAHELGHVLGFPDCYLEFYEEKHKHSVYYDLDFDQGNLMCDTDFTARAPMYYLEQLKDKACQ